MPGAVKLVQHLERHGIPIAVCPPRDLHTSDSAQIATGSTDVKLAWKTGHLPELMRCFARDRIVTADTLDALGLPGKPAPDVFLLAAERLGFGSPAARASTLVFEDSPTGLVASRAAGMMSVWVPDADLFPGAAAEPPTERLSSLEDFRPEAWGLPPF